MDVKKTKQMNEWADEFGKEYTDRNPQSVVEMDELYKRNFGVYRTELNKEFLGRLDRSMRILEVGCNVGTQLQCLQEMGFCQLYGIELQPYAVELAKNRSRNINIIQGSCFDIPFKDGFFDLVFTSGVLIHINPDDIGQALDEIYRCSKTYIWGFEYYAQEHTMIPYRGKNNLLWKADFAKLYMEQSPGLETIKEKSVPYLESENVDMMYLLKK